MNFKKNKKLIALHTWTPRAVYIHIPFCANKCFYCDFTSYIASENTMEAYLDALEREMAQTVYKFPPQRIDTVFVGGGTPTLLNISQLQRLVVAIRKYFPLSSEVEFTMEANPGTTDKNKLVALRDSGVNRISFGAQSFDNTLLKGIGRIHNADDIARSIENAKNAGFTNLSLDLMFGLPHQTLGQLKASLQQALALDLPHYSLYGLKVEENTVFHKLNEKNQLHLPSESIEVAMYEHLMGKLREESYEQYEISNFARIGFASEHNQIYWRNEPYYGLGAGACGYVFGQRHTNLKGIKPYLEATKHMLPRLEICEISMQEAQEDFMMLGLRMLKGIERSHFNCQFNGCSLDEVFAHQLSHFVHQGLLEQTSQGFKLTQKGILLGNEVFASFL